MTATLPRRRPCRSDAARINRNEHGAPSCTQEGAPWTVLDGYFDCLTQARRLVAGFPPPGGGLGWVRNETSILDHELDLVRVALQLRSVHRLGPRRQGAEAGRGSPPAADSSRCACRAPAWRTKKHTRSSRSFHVGAQIVADRSRSAPPSARSRPPWGPRTGCTRNRSCCRSPARPRPGRRSSASPGSSAPSARISRPSGRTT